MRSMLVLGAVLAVFFAEASADEETALALLRDVAAEANAYEEKRFAFTVDYSAEENGEAISAVLRFDPRRPSGEKWDLIGADIDDLTKDERKRFKALQKDENGDKDITYAGVDEMLTDVSFVDETETHARFRTPLSDEDLPDGVMEALLTVDKNARYISEIRVQTIKPFKPAPIAKIKSLFETLSFSPPAEEGGPVLLTRSESGAEGKAMFRKFSAKSVEIYSDIEIIDASDIPSRSSDD
ncbi:MAG: hypothetical protein AAGA09_05095 [Pseudomonadota bacterium]